MSARGQLFAALPRGDAGSSDAERTALAARLDALGFGNGAGDADLFIERAREAGSTALRCATLDEAAACIVAAARRIAASTGRPCRCIAARSELFARAGVADRLAEAGSAFAWVTDPGLMFGAPTARSHYAAADLGITVGHAGLADSGAIVISSSQSESRSVSLLPSEHLAIVPAHWIHRSLLQTAPLLRALSIPGGSSAVTLVGGPSKTADIEKVLVTGVHGPEALTILVVDAID